MPRPARSPGPRLLTVANLWSLWDHPSAPRDWTLERKVAAVAEAGFDGVAAALDRRLGSLASKHGLRAVGYIASSDPAQFRSRIRRNQDGGAERINVQLGDHDTPAERAVGLAVGMVEAGEELGVPCDIEVHRDTCTETPEKLAALAAGFRTATGRLLPVTWDFSHLAVVKHLAPPYWKRLLIDRELIGHARQFHFRPFNGQHCQIPVTDGRGGLSPEFRQWLPFLDKALGLWLSANRGGGEMYACPEMGPVRGGYNLSALPASWEDAKVLRGILAARWRRALSDLG